jgi:hypothetical protein
MLLRSSRNTLSMSSSVTWASHCVLNMGQSWGDVSVVCILVAGLQSLWARWRWHFGKRIRELDVSQRFVLGEWLVQLCCTREFCFVVLVEYCGNVL